MISVVAVFPLTIAVVCYDIRVREQLTSIEGKLTGLRYERAVDQAFEKIRRQQPHLSTRPNA